MISATKVDFLGTSRTFAGTTAIVATFLVLAVAEKSVAIGSMV